MRLKGIRTLTEKGSLESLGNKSLLEKSINIRASDYRFEDKRKYYLGYTNDKGKVKTGTMNKELIDMAKVRTDFLESDIQKRKQDIIEEFLHYITDNGLSL